MFSEVAEIALVAALLGQFQQLLKTSVTLILNFTRPHAITFANNGNWTEWSAILSEIIRVSNDKTAQAWFQAKTALRSVQLPLYYIH